MGAHDESYVWVVDKARVAVGAALGGRGREVRGNDNVKIADNAIVAEDGYRLFHVHGMGQRLEIDGCGANGLPLRIWNAEWVGVLIWLIPAADLFHKLF